MDPLNASARLDSAQAAIDRQTRSTMTAPQQPCDVLDWHSSRWHRTGYILPSYSSFSRFTMLTATMSWHTAPAAGICNQPVTNGDIDRTGTVHKDGMCGTISCTPSMRRSTSRTAGCWQNCEEAMRSMPSGRKRGKAGHHTGPFAAFLDARSSNWRAIGLRWLMNCHRRMMTCPD